MRREAIEFCKAGFRVIPLQGKEPFWPNWSGRAIADPFDVVELWPGDQYNVGIVCGGGMFVVDIDVKNNKPGFESLAKLIAQNGPFPPTRTVRTPSGGKHFYFYTPDRSDVANAVDWRKNEVGEGIDIKGRGGQVGAPGNKIKDKDGVERFYVLEDALPIAVAPQWLVDALRAAPVKSESAGVILGETDKPGDVERARAWLKASPDVYEGGRDNAGYKMAARFLDFGALETCRELLDEWNETKCNPPLEESDLDRIASSARKNRQEPIGRDSMFVGFAPIPDPPPVRVEDLPLYDEIWRFDQTEADEEAMPPRPWIAYRRLIRGKLSLMVAPGSIGKSLFSLQWACAIAMGKGDWCGLDVREKCDVLVVNNEDDRGEMGARLAAVIRQFALRRRDVWQHVHLRGSDRGRFQIMERAGKYALQRSKRVDELIEYIKAYKIGVVIFDPLVSLHQADENNNVEMDTVCEEFKRIAAKTGAAILLVHHTRKPPQASSDSFAGSADAGRGASAVVNAARVAITAFGMSEKDAKKYGIPERERGRYVRLDDAKANLFLAAGEAQWFRRETIKLPSGEEGGALRPVELIDKSGGELSAVLNAVAEVVEPGETVSVYTLAKRLARLTFFSGLGETAAKSRLVAALNMADDTTYRGKRLEFVPSGKTGGDVTAVEVQSDE